MALSELEKTIGRKVGVAYARQFVLRELGAGVEAVIQSMEYTAKAMGISVRECVDHYGLKIDADHADQICDAAVDAFMAESKKIHLACSAEPMRPN